MFKKGFVINKLEPLYKLNSRKYTLKKFKKAKATFRLPNFVQFPLYMTK